MKLSLEVSAWNFLLIHWRFSQARRTSRLTARSLAFAFLVFTFTLALLVFTFALLGFAFGVALESSRPFDR